jgi:hypothetical protein
MVLHAKEGGDMRMAYYGPKVATLAELQAAGADFDFSALPAFPDRAAMAIRAATAARIPACMAMIIAAYSRS